MEERLASVFNVTNVPTFILLEKGAKKAQLTGLRSKKDFEKWLSEN
jgi:thioredoxin-like negative regulator of GroEL